MVHQPEAVLAWDLAERHHAMLPAGDRTAVWVALGIGDYLAAIRRILNGLVAQRLHLSIEEADNVGVWITCYDNGTEFGALLSRLTPAL